MHAAGPHICCIALTLTAVTATAQIVHPQWEAFGGPRPASIDTPGRMSEPVQLTNPMLQAVHENIYRWPWAPADAMLLEAHADTAGLQAFGFWIDEMTFDLIIRRDQTWHRVTPTSEEAVKRPFLAFFGHDVSGQAVAWDRPPRIVVFGRESTRGLTVRRIQLWDAGCIEMTLRRCDHELARARQLLNWSHMPHERESQMLATVSNTIADTRGHLHETTSGLLDTYMDFPEPRYALEVIANHCRHYRSRFPDLGYPDAWNRLFYGRPEFQASVDVRKAAERALWSERPLTLPREAKDLYGEQAKFALGLTHGLTKIRRDRPFPAPLNSSYRTCLARGEYESMQLVLASWHNPIRGATASIAWEGPGPHPDVVFRPVGYVHTRPDGNVTSGDTGWWPSPLLPTAPVDVAAGGTQPIWASIHANAETAPGDHRATITVSTENLPPLQCELTVRVFNFDLGFTHLPSLLSLRFDSIKSFYRLDELSQSIRRRWYAFCLEYRMNPNNIYAKTPIPGPEDLAFCVERGLNAVVMHVPPLYETSRNSTENLEIWISDDNETYRRVESRWQLNHDRNANIVITGLDLSARYIKCHSTVKDTHFQVSMSLEPGSIVAYHNEKEMLGRVGFANQDDGSKPLTHWGASWGAALDYPGHSVGIDLGESRGVTGLRLVNRNGGVNDILETIKGFYSAAKANGLGDRAYLYGFDEWKSPEAYGIIKKTYDLAKAAAPGVKACSTVVHPVAPITEVIDAWCPCLCYNYPGHDEARRRGDEVWYYSGGTPFAPFPTHELINAPAVEARAYFWIAWRYGYTGWLHWELNHWGNNMGTDARWPDIPWDPASGKRNYFTRIYPGPDATPLPSIRLENMRDGIEDYDYFWLLDERCRKLPDDDPRKQETATLMEEAITVLCRSRADFERDPDKVHAIHEQLGSAIEKLQ